MIIYRCEDCDQESGYTELNTPKCRFCKKTRMKLVSKQELTPEVLAARLVVTTDNMMKNLEAALNILPSGDPDAEGDLLRIMARAKELRDKVQGLKLEEPKAGN